MKRKRYFKDEFIGNRRFELFKRDPLAIEMENLCRKSFSDNVTNDERDVLSNRVEKLAKDLMKKWDCDFIPKKYIPAEPFSWFEFSSGAFTVANVGEYIEEFLEKLESGFQDSSTGFPNPASLEHFERKGWVFYYLDGAYDDRGNVYIPVPPGSIPIIVDPGGLTRKSKAAVTKEIWNIIEREIKKRRSKIKEQWKYIPAVRDSQELGFISTMAEDIFAKYLKWYDLHMGIDYQSPKGLHFRTIAYHEWLERKHPDKAEEAKKKLAERTKTMSGK